MPGRNQRNQHDRDRTRKSWGIFLQTMLDVYITSNLCTMLVAAAVTINGPIEGSCLRILCFHSNATSTGDFLIIVNPRMIPTLQFVLL
jgi:hypothetical protein